MRYTSSSLTVNSTAGAKISEIVATCQKIFRQSYSIGKSTHLVGKGLQPRSKAQANGSAKRGGGSIRSRKTLRALVQGVEPRLRTDQNQPTGGRAGLYHDWPSDKIILRMEGEDNIMNTRLRLSIQGSCSRFGSISCRDPPL